jgi:phage shock protein C
MAVRRNRQDRFLGGVLGGIARALRISPWLLRAIFIALLLSRIFLLPALALYILAWMFLPEADEGPGIRGWSGTGLVRLGPIRRSRRERMLAGVCGGLAEYYHLNPLWLRIGVFLFTLLTLGWGSVAYIVAAFAVPLESR